MVNSRFSRAAVFATIILVSVTAFTDSRGAVSATACAAAPTERCVFELARSAADEVIDDRRQVNADYEVALALAATNNEQAATKLLQRGGRIAGDISSSAESIDARLDLANGFVAVGDSAGALSQLAAAQAVLADVADQHKRADLEAKLAVATVAAGETSKGLEIALRLPQEDEGFAAYKARALHDIAPILAARGDLAAAQDTIDAITMGITYYQSVVRSDVGYLAATNGQATHAETLFAEASEIALAQDSGYFVAGALRQVADAQARAGFVGPAGANFERAASAAREAPTAQERARAISRVVTSLADNRMAEPAGELISEAFEIASSEPDPAMRSWALYEVSGAAAFAGLFDLAEEALSEIPADLSFAGVSLRSATQRDIAWGLARHGKAGEAIRLAATIESARERTQAFARIVRAMADPEMRALPRYL